MVRMRLTEADPVFPRHVIPAGDAVAETPPAAADTSMEKLDGKTLFTFKTTSGVAVRAELRHSPLRLDVFAGGVLLQRLNARNSLNFERYRQNRKEVLPPDAASSVNPAPSEVTLDSAAWPDVDTNGLWEEDFGGHTDRKPRGPASIGMDVTFEGDVPSLFGLPEHATKAALPFYEEPYRFFNLDVFEYEIDEPMALYGAVPLLWGVHRTPEGTGSMASAFLWINPSETFVKLERAPGADAASGPAHTWWTSESGVVDAVVMVGPTPAMVSAQFHALTGLAPLPPLWALGKHQCRWNYMTERDVATVDASYDKYDIPYDVVWLDIEHTDGKAYFTWHKDNFPTPRNMMDAISAKRRKFVNVVDPHIKKDNKFHVYTDIRDKGLFIKTVDWKWIDDPTDVKPADWLDEAEAKIPDPEAKVPEGWNEEDDGKWEPSKIDNPEYKGVWKPRQIEDPNSPLKDFEGWCWPGTSGYPDFPDPKMREYWGSQFALDKYEGTNADLYIWNDMNEPSVFNGPEVTCPRDAVHPHGGTGARGGVEHRDLHNMYGYYVHRATFEGLAGRVEGDRPFVLTRSFFIGSHRYAAIWTGDNYAKWEHLQASIAMVGALAVAGQSLVGADVGGFFKHPEAEMVTRWYQLAVLAYPFLRNHAHLETPRREPYVYDEATMQLVKTSLQLRYRMLPLWYTLFQEYASQGKPVVRPLFWDFLADVTTQSDEDAVENEIMLGDVVLVRGICKPMEEVLAGVTVYLPMVEEAVREHRAGRRYGGWYDLYTGAFFSPGKHTRTVDMEGIPAFYRAGAIVPLKSRVRRSSSCTRQDPFTIAVYLNPTTGSASGHLYIDDYSTKNYTDGASFLDLHLTYSKGTLSAASSTGSLPEGLVATEIERIEVYGLGSPGLGSATANGVALPAPVSRRLPAGSGGESERMFMSTIKVVPYLDMRKAGWQVVMA